jgi:hypothetical protein
MSKAKKYTYLRLSGKGSRESAREAGFNTGCPGDHALELYEAALSVQDKTLDELLESAREAEAELKEQQQKTNDLRRKVRARRIVQKVESE